MRNKKKPETILIVDDASETIEILHRNLELAGYTVHSCEDAKAAMELLGQQAVDLVITDYHMPFIGGMDVIRHVKENYHDVEVMMITGYASVEGAVEAMKAGAEEYLSKPFTNEELEEAVERALKKRAQRLGLKGDSGSNPAENHGLVCASKTMQAVLKKAVKLAKTSSEPVFISAELGTEKELLARLMHYEGDNSEALFLNFDCQDVPADRHESELFGAFGKSGDLDTAHCRPGLTGRGTLFLDNVECLAPNAQLKLLHYLESCNYAGKGDECRIICSSSRDMLNACKFANFRQDLFFLLNNHGLRLPPLRERKEDISRLCQRFLARFCEYRGRESSLKLSPSALEILEAYEWRGNVIELQQVMDVLAETVMHNLIEAADLPEYMRYNILKHEKLDRTLKEVERDYIKAVLHKLDGNKTKAAEQLGIDRKTLREKLKP